MIVNLARAIVLLSILCIGFALAGEEMSAETKARLCNERAATLRRLEQEAPQLRFQIDALARKIAAIAAPNQLQNARLELRRWRQLHSTVRTEELARVETQILYWEREVAYWRSPLPYGANVPDRARLTAELNKLQERQTYVASQISLLRESMQALGCAGATPPASTAKAPPVAPTPPPVTPTTPPSGPATRPDNVVDLSGKWVARMDLDLRGAFQELTLTLGPWQNGEFSGPLMMTRNNAPAGRDLPPAFARHVYAVRPAGFNRFTVQPTGRIVPTDLQGGTRIEPMRAAPYFATFDGPTRTLTIRFTDPPLAFVKASP